MVRLSQIYTKTGDDGTTGLGDGTRVAKTDLRVEAYGTVDEANSFVGLCVCAAEGDAGSAAPGASTANAIGALLKRVQNDLFDVGADLCRPVTADEKPAARLRVSAAQTLRLENEIDAYNARLKPLNSFVLPGGGRLASSLHAARAVVRRAERCVVALTAREGPTVNTEAVRYLNRLSDLLFVLARVANRDGAADVLWSPGAGAGGAGSGGRG